MTKALELFSNCIIVIAGPEAIKGLQLTPGKHYFLAESLSKMVDILVQVIKNLSSNYRIACNAQSAIREMYNIDTLLHVYKNSY